jgi:plasmid replication initiation protein
MIIMIKTIEYRIKLNANNKEHNKTKRLVANLFKALDKKFDGDIEFYTQYVSTINYGKRLYGLESKSTLDKLGI